MKLNFSLIGLTFLMMAKASAATDPISFELLPAAGFPDTKVGHQSSIQYTLTNHLPFAATLITEYQFRGGAFSIHDDCHNRSVASGGSCQVIVGFKPAAAGNSSFNLIYGYHNNRVSLPAITAIGIAEPSTTVLSGTIVGLPPSFYSGEQVDYTAVFTNKGHAQLTGCTISNFTSTGVPAVLNTAQGIPPCGATLDPGDSCHLDGTATANASGILKITGHMRCTGPAAVSSAPHASAIVKKQGGCTVHANVLLPLPETTHTYSDNIVKYVIENECPGAVGLGNISIQSSGGDPVITRSKALSTCGSTIAGLSECYVFASVIPQKTGAMSITLATVTGTGEKISAVTSTKILAPGYNHTINFINQCPFPVWYGVQNNPGDPDVQDPTKNPSPDTYRLARQVPGSAPVVKSITFPGKFFGDMFPRTGCTGGTTTPLVCKTADCNSGNNGKCNGDGHSPYTRIEEVFFNTVVGAGYQGTYDISVINGISIPVEMKGLGPKNSAPAFAATPFYCAGAGAPIQPPQAGSETLGNCSWNFTVPTNNKMNPRLFNFVEYNAPNYNCAAPCNGGEVCGLAYIDNNPENNVTMSCGKLIGYWTINQSCGPTTYDALLPNSDNPKSVFKCATVYNNPGRAVQQYPTPTTYYDIYSCNTPPGPNPNKLGSCYPSTSGNLCCGAKNWNKDPYLTAQDKNADHINPDWIGSSSPLLPTPFYSILWIKEGCPTAYVYPYDDHSSSFRCYTSDAAQRKLVKMDFDVVFCPGGLTGQLSTDP